MLNREQHLIYALKDGVVKHISEVENGLKCGCVCPACGAKLVAKKGTQIQHHFAHCSVLECEYGYETSLHLAAKEILKSTREMVIPPVYLEFPGKRERIKLSEARTIHIDHVEIEKRIGEVIPDVIIYTGKKLLFLEIYVTHKVDENKVKKLRNLKSSTIEIDLSTQKEVLTKEKVEKFVLEDNNRKVWKYNAAAEKAFQRFKAIAECKKVFRRGYALQVDYCPVERRMFRGRAYANAEQDCSECEYCVLYSLNEVWCTGKHRISRLEDFALSEEERIEKSNVRLQMEMYEKIDREECPCCGNELIKRSGKNGEFIGCNNYPHCRFTYNINSETGEIEIRR